MYFDGKKLHYKRSLQAFRLNSLDSNVGCLRFLILWKIQIALPDSPVQRQVIESGDSETQTAASASNNKEADKVKVVVKPVPEKNMNTKTVLGSFNWWLWRMLTMQKAWLRIYKKRSL